MLSGDVTSTDRFVSLRGWLHLAEGRLVSSAGSLTYPEWGGQLEGPIRVAGRALELSGRLAFGVAQPVAERLAESGRSVRFKRFAAPDRFSHTCGDQEFHRAATGLDAPAIADALVALARAGASR